MPIKMRFPEQLSKMQERSSSPVKDAYPDMAAKIGASERTVFDLIHGKWAIEKIELLGRICDYLGCMPGDLFEYTPTTQGKTPSPKKASGKK